MQLNSRQQERLIDALTAVWTNRVCERCGNSDWSVSDRLCTLPLYAFRNVEVGPPGFALVFTSCVHCGNVATFNAITLGIVDQATGEVVDG